MSAATATLPRTAAEPHHSPGVLGTTRWELRKIAAQARTRWALLAAAVAPVLIVFIINSQGRPPKDSLYGRYIHHSGFAVALLVLGFAAQWILPLVTALVAGDIFASEDQHGTWKTLLTRSASRAQVFWGKVIAAVAFAIAALIVLATSTIVASVLIVGHQPLVGLTGQLIPSGTAARLVVESWATALPPLLGFTCLAIMLSVFARSSAFGIAAPVVVAMVMQMVGSLGGIDGLRPLLLTTPFEAWHGLLAAPSFTGPLTSGLGVCAAWIALTLTISFVALRRRDITGG